MFTEDQKNLLGLSKNEGAVLESINSSQKNLCCLSRDTNIPRASLYILIKRLYDRGFVKYVKHGSRFFYEARTPAEIARKLHTLASNIEQRFPTVEINIQNLNVPNKTVRKIKWLSIFKK